MNLQEDEQEGLKSLKRRIKEGEILVMKTDKSSKLAVTTRDEYVKMGEVHTRKDKPVKREEIREIEKNLNGHSRMWAKMMNVGEHANHEDRVMDSVTTKSQNLATMYVLLKDHKKTRQTRPVVSGCDSNTAGMSHLVSELLEAVANSVEDPYEVVSAEDMLARIEDCNKEMRILVEEKKERGEDTSIEEDLIILGSDVVALFPNLTSKRTGKKVRGQVEKSELKIDGVNFKEVVRYVKVNEDHTSGLGELRKLLPWRRKHGGTRPGMKNKEINGKKKDTEIAWVFPARKPTMSEKRQLMGVVAEIGVRVLFENFVYTFAGQEYLQTGGGPIGARVTMAASRLVMQDWGETYKKILTENGVKVRLMAGYVDDGRQGTSLIKRGTPEN
jgi:hypothetical protein